MLDKLNSIKNPTYMIYFSDHGTSVDIQHLRNPNSADNMAYEIPFWVYTNEMYNDKYPEVLTKLDAAKHRPLQSDRTHYGILEIMRAIFPQNTDEENFLSSSFTIKPRFKNEGRVLYYPVLQ